LNIFLGTARRRRRKEKIATFETFAAIARQLPFPASGDCRKIIRKVSTLTRGTDFESVGQIQP